MKTHFELRGLVLAGALALGLPATAGAQVCAPTDQIEPLRFLRQLTLDLYGRAPTLAEQDMVREVGSVTDELIDQMLASPEYLDWMEHYHQQLLWGNLRDIQIASNARLAPIYYQASSGQYIFDRHDVSYYIRGEFAGCADIPHDNFDANGNPLPLADAYADGAGGTVRGAPITTGSERCTAAHPCRIDGWVDVIDPHWAPGTTVRVCAFDALGARVRLGDGRETVLPQAPQCVTGARGQSLDRGCGCGPNALGCVSDFEWGRVQRSLVREPLKIFRSVIEDPSADYVSALTTGATYVNGPLAHYYQYGREGLVTEDIGAMPSVPYGQEDTWVRVERDATQGHSGILTTPGFMWRFQSYRARISRFYSSFLCRPFTASDNGIQPSSATPHPDLAQRDSCDECHATIEPESVFFARWGHTNTYGYLNTTSFPSMHEFCRTCSGDACAGCEGYWFTPMSDPSIGTSYASVAGMLRVFAYRTEQEIARANEGPAGLVREHDSEFAACATRNMAENLLGRPIRDDEATWLAGISDEFSANGRHFSALVRRLVRDDRYRRIR